jgi:magnesium-transporting ATPase (P-type)
LNGINFEWKKFFEPFGYDSYLMGPEYKTKAPPGTYEIRVWSSNNDSKYALAIGETENFDAEESANALRLIPKIKRDFFDKSPADFIFSVFGYGYVLGIFLLAFVFGFISRAVLKKIAKKSTRGLSKNINFADRFLRVFLGVALFWIAITTTWNPFVLFLSGFCFFEALAGWCGLYAAIGKNSCPV